MSDDASEKILIRERMKKLRNFIDLGDYRKWCMSIVERCKSLPGWSDSRIVHIYVSSKNNEVDTLGLIYSMLDYGKQVVVPRCSQNSGLDNIRIKSLDELKSSKYGLMEPDYRPGSIVQPDQFDMIIVPLLAFDRSGGRLGFGGGYYDKLLEKCVCKKVGLAYSFQEVEKVPAEAHDCKLDIIITEKETIRV